MMDARPAVLPGRTEGPAAKLAVAARENPTFAGAFAYDSQVPMKTFMGNAAVAPLKPLLEALDGMQSGAASPKARAAAQTTLMGSACLQQANKEFQQCISSKGDHKMCMQAAQKKMAMCASVGA